MASSLELSVPFAADIHRTAGDLQRTAADLRRTAADLQRTTWSACWARALHSKASKMCFSHGFSMTSVSRAPVACGFGAARGLINLRIWLPAWRYSERQAVIFLFSFPYHCFEFDFEFVSFSFLSSLYLTLHHHCFRFFFCF